MSEMSDVLELKKAVKALKSQRNILGDSVVNSSVKVIEEKIAALKLKARDRSKQLRRYVTVMFADVSGFTSICSQNDAENVTMAINTLWSALDFIIVSNGGFVDKHIGDCVMAVWGLDGVRENDSARAVRAALAMQSATKSISVDSAGLIPPFNLRIGLHCGHVFITSIGLNKEYTVMGDTVNIANRLQSHSPLGSVLVSYETWKHIRTDFVFQQQPPLKVKGVEKKLDTYIIKEIVSDSFSQISTSLFGTETVMVGRKKELSLFLKILNTVYSTGLTGMITLVGEAGIGKSRLLHEFNRVIERDKRKAIFFNARCTPDMLDIPCAIFRDILRIKFSVKENDSIDVLFQKLEKGMKDIPSIQEIHLACNFAGFNMSSSQYIQRVERDDSLAAAGRTALVKYFKVIAKQERTLMFLEDLHWADSVSLSLVEEIVREIPEAELLVICLTRPPLLERNPDWGKGLPNTFVYLEPLSSDESKSLVEVILQRIQNLSSELINLITTNADGNPFYVEELIKMLVEDNVISTETWTVNTEVFTKEKVPSTLTGVLQARLDSLSASERNFLQIASVIGRSFWDKVIRDISAENSAVVLKNLSSAESHDLVRKMSLSTFSGASEYLFKHAILRDVTYETVLLKARRRYHNLVAAWLEKNSEDRIDEFASVIAHHYENGEDWENAVKWLIKSGRLAMSFSAYKEALSRFRRALYAPGGNLYPAQEAQLHLDCGSCLEKLSSYDEAVRELDQAVVLARQSKLYTILADSLLAHTWVAILTGRHDEVQKYAEDAFKFAKLSGDSSVLARAFMRMADFEEEQNYEKVISYYQKAFSLYLKVDNESGLAISLLNMGNIAIAFKYLDKAEKCYKESLSFYTKIGSRWGIANCLGNLGGVFAGRNEFDKACEYFQKSLDVSQSIGDKEGEVICNLNLGQAAISTDNPVKSTQYLNSSLKLAISVNLLPLATEALKCMAKAYLDLNEIEKAALILFVIKKEPFSALVKLDIDKMLDELVEFKSSNRYQEILEQASNLNISDLSNQILSDSSEH